MKKNTEFRPEIKRVTLHPLKDDGTIDTDVNLYPKTLIDGIVDRDGKHVDIQEKLIAGDNITIDGNVISATGGGSGTEYVIDITELDQLEHPINQEQGEEIFETQPDCIHLIYNVNVDAEELTVHLNGDAYLIKQINLHQEISDPDETKEYENAIVYTLLSDDTLNAIKINKSPDGEIIVNDMAEWNFADIVDSIAGKANNSEVVHLNGDETIDGHKTFTGGFNVSTYNGFGLENDGCGISASDTLYLYGYKEINDTTAFYGPIIIEKTSKFITSDANKYGLVLPDTTDYTDNRVIATENYVDNSLSTKQDTLVSGTNIKTINNESLLGSGDIAISGGYDIYDYDDTAETAERIYNDQPAAIKVSQPDTDLEVYLHKVEFRDNTHYYSGSTFNENLGGWVTVVLKVIFDGNETYSSETSYYHSYSEIDLGQTGGAEEVYLQQPMIVHMQVSGFDVFLQKADFIDDILHYRAAINNEQFGGDVILEISVSQTTDPESETGDVSYDVTPRVIPIGGQPVESDLTIMTNPADMVNIVHAYATGDSTGFKENHKYGLSGDTFVDFFTDSLNSEDLYWLMRGRSYENRLIMFNGEKLKLDKSVTNTYRLHNSDDSVQITLVRAEEDTVTVNISDQFAYLEIIFFHYEGE